MGDDKQTTDTSRQQEQTSTYTPSAEEKEMQQIMLRKARASEKGDIGLTSDVTKTIQGILSGGTGLPDIFSSLFAGISPELTSEMAGEAVNDLMPTFGKQGILDSGTAASIAGRTAGDIRLGSAENNLSRVFNMLNLGLGFGGQQQQLGNQGLAGLTSALKGTGTTTGTGSMTGTSTVTSMNPFLKSFQTSLGTGLAGGLTGGIGGALGGISPLSNFSSGWGNALGGK